MASNKVIEVFARQDLITDDFTLGLSAGHVCDLGGRFAVGYETFGAQDTFSVGQPVYDKENNLMGYLDTMVMRNLNVHVEGNDFHGEDIPSFSWAIGNPTKHCQVGKKIFTYWQRWKEIEVDNEQTNHI